MKNEPSVIARARATFFVVAALVAIASCAKSPAPFASAGLNSVDEISRGTLGRLEPIVVRFRDPIAAPEALARAARLTPPTEGAWSLRDERTIVFAPTKPYRANSLVTLRVDVGLLAGQDEGRKGFDSPFRVRPASLAVECDGLVAEDDSGDRLSLSGSVVSDIPIPLAEARKAVKASLARRPGSRSGDGLEIEWETSGDSARHRFSVKTIDRSSAERYLVLAWKDAPAGKSRRATKSFLVPAREDFRVLEIAAADDSCIQVRFSDRLDPSQDVRGFVDVPKKVNVRYNIDGNLLSLYATDGWDGNAAVSVRPGVLSASGKALAQPVAATITAAWEIPEIRFPTDGVILPTTEGVVVPIETKNLTGVIVEAFVIPGDNILQFLQVNELDGHNELRRVGEPAWAGTFDFNWDDGMKNRFVPRGLDLTALVRKNPGSMIQIRVTFRSRHVKYVCAADHRDFSSLPMPTDEIPVDRFVEKSYWDFAGDMDWKVRRTYWDYRKDPCHPAFYIYDYNEDVLARKNLLISNLGVLTKREGDGTFRVAVSDIGTTAPVPGATVAFYSYAQRPLVSATTDARGLAAVKPPAEPYFITATKGGMTSYLRVDDGTSLSVSHFQVDGVKAEGGVKGFLYGERGVWRPGDPMHLVFVLQDGKKSLPSRYPVSFELVDPQGVVAKSQIVADSVDGFYRIDTGTAADAPSGAWTARVTAGGQSWTKSLRVEAIVPNRLSIDMKADRAILMADGNAFTLKAAWLHGAPAPGLKADVTASFYPASTSFDGFSEYSFSNPERSVESSDQLVWEGTLDSASQARFSINLNAGDNLPGKLKAILATRVFEPSGAFSVEQAQYAFSPYSRYVGLRLPKGDAARGMLLTDTKHRVELAVLDAEGKPVQQDVALSVSVYKLEWRWWWEKDALTDATYVSDRSTKLVSQGQAVARKGRATWELEIKYPEWGRYLVVAEDSSGGHSAAKIVYVDWPGWAGRGAEAGTGSAAMLPLVRDRELYRVGDVATLSFESSKGGRALITVEKNGSVLSEQWIDTVQGTTTARVPLTAGMAPNVYAHVTLLQPHMQTKNSLPIRLYGVLPLMVEDPATRLQPVVSAPETFVPGSRCTLSVSEASGKAMTYTVAVVDEGLLGLTRFKAANPWDEFYKKEASRLASWDIYRYVMSAFGGKLETLLSVGGSEDLLNGNKKKTDRFKPVVLFFGPFELAPGARAEVPFDMPEYVGAVRVMVTAGKAGAYGVAERTVPVKSDLMVIASAPRTLGSGETVEVPITVFNGKQNRERVTVSLAATGAASVSMERVVEVDGMSNGTVSFPVSAGMPGTASFVARAATASAGARQSFDVAVLSRGSPVANVRSFIVKPGERRQEFAPSPGEKGTISLAVELSSLPVLDLKARLRYLPEYPRGCVEQITSKAFPQLYVPSMLELSAEETERVKKNVASTIERYPSYQTPSGGFAYWPGSPEETGWGTCYAGHFMVEARKAGYSVPDSLYASWLNRQRDLARAWEPGLSGYESEVQAYRLYTLALAGKAEIGPMNRLRSAKALPFAARWLLAASYALAGHRGAAAEIARDTPVEPEFYRDTGSNWGSSFRDSALALHALGAIGDARASSLVVPVAESLAASRWYSTQETAWMILALAPHYGFTDKTPARWTIEWDRGEISGEIKRSAVVRDLEPFDSPTQTVAVRNDGTKPIYGRIVTRGLVSPGQEKALEGGISLRVKYLNADGRAVDPSSLRTGDSVTIVVTARNLTKKRVENLALSVPIPTCWEFSNDRLAMEGDEAAKAGLYDWRDIKDTHVHTYFALDPNESREYAFKATVSYAGTYYVPAIRVEAMYNAEIQALVPGQLVKR